MGKAKLWQSPDDPFGPYVGQCCDNCMHFWFDGDTYACDLNQQLWDNRYWQDPPQDLEELNDDCPDWVSRFVGQNQKQSTLI